MYHNYQNRHWIGMVIARLFHPKVLVSFPRRSYPETIDIPNKRLLSTLLAWWYCHTNVSMAGSSNWNRRIAWVRSSGWRNNTVFRKWPQLLEKSLFWLYCQIYGFQYGYFCFIDIVCTFFCIFFFWNYILLQLCVSKCGSNRGKLFNVVFGNHIRNAAQEIVW